MVTKMKTMGVKGFSLVELMIVVAIIGILAAVAIPNFQRFQRKARQSEASALLGGIHGAQAAFHGQWEVYNTDLPSTGFVPNGTLRYNAGFSMNTALPAIVGYTGPAQVTTVFNTNAVCGVYMAQCTSGEATAVTMDAAPAGTGNAATFTASAYGMIGGAVPDQWSITQLKVLSNFADGTL